ncbi:MAG: hypothetical protein H7X71_03625, partial [Chitinophagales bacterium]|nr:hypothetical protein [Chitinophagales bacterium]
MISKTKIKFISAVIFLSISSFCFAQQNEALLFIDSTTIIGNIKGDKVYVSETDIAYALQGKIIYQGERMDAEHMLLIADVKDFFSKKTGIVYQSNGKSVQYITQKQAVYLGDYPINIYYERVLFVEQKNDSLILVFDGITEKQIGFIEGKNMTSTQLISALHLYIKHYDLDRKVKKIADEKLAEELALQTAGGTIRQKYGNNIYYEWVWDGIILKPAWGNRLEDEWKFDGKYFQPSWSLDPQSEWSWENGMLKPSWDNTAQNQWIWDGNILRPFWETNPDKMYVMEDNVLRPYWSYDPSLQWEIEGSIPLPVIALV